MDEITLTGGPRSGETRKVALNCTILVVLGKRPPVATHSLMGHRPPNKPHRYVRRALGSLLFDYHRSCRKGKVK